MGFIRISHAKHPNHVHVSTGTLTVYDREMVAQRVGNSNEQSAALLIGNGEAAKEAKALLVEAGLVVRHTSAMPVSIAGQIEAFDLVLLAPQPRDFPPCAQIKAAHSGFLPIMVVLDNKAMTSRAEVLHAGADDVLTGLPEPEEFRLRVSNWLRIKSTHDSLLTTDPRAQDTRPPQPDPSASQRNSAPLTRITMHGLIETRLRTEHARALRHREALAFAYFSVDDAAHMLQRFGNKAVDKIAQEITQRMEESFRTSDLVYRIDTLGFGVILPHAHFEGALAVTTRAHKHITGTYQVENKPTLVSLSVGVSLFPSPRVGSYRELGSTAQLGASEALAAGGNRICVVQHSGYMFEPTG